MFQENDRVESLMLGVGTVIAVDYNDLDLQIFVRFDRLTSLGHKLWIHPAALTNLEWIDPAAINLWTLERSMRAQSSD